MLVTSIVLRFASECCTLGIVRETQEQRMPSENGNVPSQVPRGAGKRSALWFVYNFQEHACR